MEKIITLFQRNYDGDRLVRDEVTPGAEWVTAGEGIATRKWDGTACMVRAGKLYKRYDAKAGKTPPADFEAAQLEPDAVTGHWPGWVPVGDGPEDQWHRQAWRDYYWPPLSDGTYELCGPKVQGNSERLSAPRLLRHGVDTLHDAPRDFAGLRAYLAEHDIEGIVWWHPDGRMAKIKGRDFGLSRRASPSRKMTGMPRESRR